MVSTKLFHGGLRYFEYFEFRLVREALIEREVLLGAMPHISWPLRFVLPYHPSMRFEAETPTSRLLARVLLWMRGRRPAWLIRLGLFLYDHLGGRKNLPGTSRLDLRHAPKGAALKPKFETAYKYSDCWEEDSRLVALNARDASARRRDPHAEEAAGGLWTVKLEETATGARRLLRADALECRGTLGGGGDPDAVRTRFGREDLARARQPCGGAPALRSPQVLLLSEHQRADHLRHSLQD